MVLVATSVTSAGAEVPKIYVSDTNATCFTVRMVGAAIPSIFEAYAKQLEEGTYGKYDRPMKHCMTLIEKADYFSFTRDRAPRLTGLR